jgi:hypothetical protein
MYPSLSADLDHIDEDVHRMEREPPDSEARDSDPMA